MSTIEINFEILNKTNSEKLYKSIEDNLKVENVQVNNPLIVSYLKDVFNKKYEYNELKLENDEDDDNYESSDDSNNSDSDNQEILSNKKRPDTPIDKKNMTTLNNIENYLFKNDKLMIEEDSDNSEKSNEIEKTSPNDEEVLEENVKEDDSDSDSDSDINSEIDINSESEIDSDIESDSDIDSDIDSDNDSENFTFNMDKKRNKEKLYESFCNSDYIIKNKNSLDSVIQIERTFKDTCNLIGSINLNKDDNLFDNKCFIKILPLIEPIHYIKKYLLNNPTYNTFIPNQKYYNLVKKINSKYNSCYIESFMGYLLNNLIERNISIHFPQFYGCFTGIKKDFIYDITEDYDDIKHKSWFKNKLNAKLFSKEDVYENDLDDTELFSREEKEDIERISKKDNKNIIIDDIEDLEDLDDLGEIIEVENTDDELRDEIEKLSIEDKDDNKDKNTISFETMSDTSEIDLRDKLDILKFKQFPVNIAIMELMDFTLDELLDNIGYELNEDEWISILFQIVIGLYVAQKYFKMCHNDLHSSNIMFTSTTEKYIYYTVNNKHYKVETFGRIVKIIDFGRASFNFNGKWYISDVFSCDGDAEGQFDYPDTPHFNPENTHIPVNYSFDLVRLSTTIHERIEKHKRVLKLINKWMRDDFGDNVINHSDDFSLYVHVSKYCHNAKPSKVIQDKIFEDFTINKLPSNLNNKFYFDYSI